MSDKKYKSLVGVLICWADNDDKTVSNTNIAGFLMQGTKSGTKTRRKIHVNLGMTDNITWRSSEHTKCPNAVTECTE